MNKKKTNVSVVIKLDTHLKERLYNSNHAKPFICSFIHSDIFHPFCRYTKKRMNKLKKTYFIPLFIIFKIPVDYPIGLRTAVLSNHHCWLNLRFRYLHQSDIVEIMLQATDLQYSYIDCLRSDRVAEIKKIIIAAKIHHFWLYLLDTRDYCIGYCGKDCNKLAVVAHFVVLY